MDMPKILEKNPGLFDDYREVIVNRAKFGPKRAYKDLSLLEQAAIEHHFMDSSTGTLRELAALWLTGATPVPGQHGHDGERDGKPIECKPRIWKPSEDKNTKKKNANGYGCINDHSITRHEKYLLHGLIMQQSQFFDGMCAWIIEFPYSYNPFVAHMEYQISKKNGRVLGKFNYLHYYNCPDVKIQYLNKRLIKKNKENIVGGKHNNRLYKWLVDK